MKSQTETGSILNPHHRRKAVRILTEEAGVFAAHVLTVFGLLADAKQELSIRSLLSVKGRPPGTAFAAMLPPRTLPELADFQRMTEPFRSILKNPALSSRYYRIPHFLQIPVKKGANLPEALITRSDDAALSNTIINLWFPGYRPTDHLLELAFEQGVLIACTSLNLRHHTSVINTCDAEDFCRRSSEVTFVLRDEYATRHVLPFWSGSYSILSTLASHASPSRQRLLREGNVSAGTLQRLYQCEISAPQRVLDEAHPLELSIEQIKAILADQYTYPFHG